MDDRVPEAEGVAVKDGLILAVGSEAEIRGLAGPDTRIVEIGAGRVLVPGFNESHSHLFTMGRSRSRVQLWHCRSIGEIQAEIEKAVREAEPGEWIWGIGWAEAALEEQREPTRHDLDPVSPRNPVIISRIYNTDCVNTLALKLAGIDRDTPNPPGGLIVRDPDTGEPNGLLKENAKDLVRNCVPEPPVEQQAQWIEAAMADYVRYGITSVMDPGVTPAQLSAYHHLYKHKGFRVRVSAQPDFRDRHFPLRHERLEHLGVMWGFGDEWFSLGPAKISLDGGLANMTSYLSMPYRKPGGRTVLRMAVEELDDIVFAFHRRGWSVGAHATGDLAHELMVRAMARAVERQPRSDVRHHLVHGYFPSERVLEIMRDYDIVYDLQPAFIYYQGDAYEAVVGRKWADRFKPLRQILDAGVKVCINSDVPTSSTYNPMIGIYSAVTRKTRKGDTLGADQAIGVREAIKAYTLGGAYKTMEEDRKGSIVPGKFADLALLAEDPERVDPERLKDIRVEMTITGGRIVYDARAEGDGR